MSSSNLLNINVDQLFEQHGVAEIDIIQKKIQGEVERKREELRTMVGERYRDLLKAADTIAKMKETSGSLRTQIQSIAGNCKSLNDQLLIGFKTDSCDLHLNRSSTKQLNNYFSTVVQIKLLTSLPEIIWSQIDNERFFVATQLFIFARHISTGLQLDPNGLMQYFPVAKKQWEIIKPFFFTIKQSALELLQKETLRAEEAADCLLSLFLLEKSNLDGILTTFVQLRSAAFLGSLTDEGEGKKRVKDRILASLKVLNSTVELIYKCFLGNDKNHQKGLIQVQLEELASDTTPPTLSLVDFNDPLIFATLPDIISKFKPKFDVPSLRPETVKASTEAWLQAISDTSNEQLKSLFSLVSSMKVIQEIKRDALALQRDKNWSVICERLHLPGSVDFYEFKYKPLINERIRDIVRQSWGKCVEITFDEVLKALKSGNSNRPEVDFWTESSNDIPLSLKQALSTDKKSNRLLMRTKGYGREVVDICTNFDTCLESIVSEVFVVLNEQDSKVEDKVALVDFLKEISQEQTSELVTKIKSSEYEEKKENFLLLARIFLALIELCPNFKVCLNHSGMSEASWDEKKTSEKWTRICGLLEEESFEFWKKFCDLILKEVEPELKKDRKIGLETILSDFVNWDTIKIEENDESDTPIESTIRIPSQPRVPLQLFLFSVSQSLNASIPQTLPQKSLVYLASQLTSSILDHYEALTADNFVTSNQNTALQLYLDLKFLQSIFTTRDSTDRPTLERFQKLTNTLKSVIDPFDFELFHSHVNTNVKRSIQRMHVELGVILPHMMETQVIQADAKSSVGHEKDPNVLSLSSNGSTSTWFPLLPIITPGSKSMEDSGLVHSMDGDRTSSLTPKSKKSTKALSSQSQNQNYASNVKSGAAAFFGAMSQDWFR